MDYELLDSYETSNYDFDNLNRSSNTSIIASYFAGVGWDNIMNKVALRIGTKLYSVKTCGEITEKAKLTDIISGSMPDRAQ